jgi:hypothetical protein
MASRERGGGVMPLVAFSTLLTSIALARTAPPQTHNGSLAVRRIEKISVLASSSVSRP